MDKLHKAITKARSFLKPAIGLTWGTRIYEAEDDSSEQSKLKNEIIDFGWMAIHHFENGLKSGSISPFSSGIEVFEEKIDGTIVLYPEQEDFRKFVNAINELIIVGNNYALKRSDNLLVDAR